MVVDKVGIHQADHRTAQHVCEARAFARELGYPLMVRTSFVLGGRAMSIVFDDEDLESSLTEALAAGPNQAIFMDRFLDDAIEIDVDALCDGHQVCIAGIMQHIEEAGIHSGDSSCVLPSPLLTAVQMDDIRRATRALALELKVVGPLNVQYAIWNGELYIIEANPRCSRTLPFAAKAVGLPLPQLAARLMAGATLAELKVPLDPQPIMWHVKSPVFPFNKFPGEDSLLGPEMKSTGEVMGNALTFGNAFAKAYRATGFKLPTNGTAFISVNDRDKGAAIDIVRDLYLLGFDLIATRGTAEFLQRSGIPVQAIKKLHEGSPNIVDYMREGKVHLVINTPIGKESHHDDRHIRLNATRYHISCQTTLSAARALVQAIRAIKLERLMVHCFQDNVAPGR